MDGGWVNPQQMHGMPGSQGQHHGAFATPPANSSPVAADPSGVPPHVQPTSCFWRAHVLPDLPARAVRSGFAVNEAELKALQAKLQETESELALFKESAVQQRLLQDTNADESNALKDKNARLQTGMSKCSIGGAEPREKPRACRTGLGCRCKRKGKLRQRKGNASVQDLGP